MQGVKIKSLQGIGMDAFAFENEDGDILKIRLVTEEGYTFLIKGYKTTGLDEYYIGTSAKFVKPDGTAW